MRQTQNDITYNFIKVAKRIAITILCCVPFLILFAYFTRGKLNNFWQIAIFVVVMGVVVLLEEVITRKKEEKKQQKQVLYKDQDVFR